MSDQLSPQVIAGKLHFTLDELAATIRVSIHRNTLRLHPEVASVQTGLGEWKRVLDLLEWIIPNDGPRLAFHARNTPMRVLEGRTIVEAVTAGQADKAARYLQTLSAGANGG
ncbi:DNA-binding protein [Pseudoxanthomonas mexicana]